MDVLERTLEQLREHDDRSRPVRLRALRNAVNLLDAAIVDQGDQRRAAAHVVVDALALLAGCGGLASDVAARMDLLGYDGSPAPSGRRIYPALVHDTTDQPDPHLGPAAPARYPPGPHGDALALADLDDTDDD